MNIIAIIPARYESTRLPGKPLLDICGKPMIWWVYQKVSKIEKFSEVVCAIDDERIKDVCEKYNMNYVVTRNDHPNHISRVHEVSEKIAADIFICVNGDEPLIKPEMIEAIIPKEIDKGIYFIGAYRKLTNPAETIDNANIKLALSKTGKCIYMSRGPVPYPKGTLFFDYNKYMGIECFTKESLDFFVKTPKGILETIEDIDHLRFIENGKDIYFKEVESDSISVDTPKDLAKVRKLIENEKEHETN